MNPIKVIFRDFPCTIRGFVVYCYDEGEVWYTIVLNAHMSDEMHIQTYEHELKHIDNEDFSKMHKVDKLEYIRHYCA